jgi:hypothetical protein
MAVVPQPAGLLHVKFICREFALRQPPAFQVEDEDARGPNPPILTLQQHQSLPPVAIRNAPNMPGSAKSSAWLRIAVAEPIPGVPGPRSGLNRKHLGVWVQSPNQVVKLDLLVLAHGPQVLAQVRLQALNSIRDAKQIHHYEQYKQAYGDICPTTTKELHSHGVCPRLGQSSGNWGSSILGLWPAFWVQKQVPRSPQSSHPRLLPSRRKAACHDAPNHHPHAWDRPGQAKQSSPPRLGTSRRGEAVTAIIAPAVGGVQGMLKVRNGGLWRFFLRSKSQIKVGFSHHCHGALARFCLQRFLFPHAFLRRHFLALDFDAPPR